MKPRVYVETSVISYLTARPSRDLIIAAHQQITADWWEKKRNEFELVASDLVVREAGRGDPVWAGKRLAIVDELVLFPITIEVAELADRLLKGKALPLKAADDAIHIAAAVVNEADYLVTWNLKHMANALIWRKIESEYRSLGYERIVICTPAELLAEETGDVE